jgi:ABC-type bacteriocin/lantibiotic exporter with double-glycine peptidase domain
VFEEDLLQLLPLEGPGYSFADLRRLVRQRGFDAEGFEITWEDLPHSGSPPLIAHLSSGHFIVVIRRAGELVYYFDSASGRTHHIDRASFLAKWSGLVLELRTL